MSEVFKLPPVKTNSVPELNKLVVEVNKLFARVSDRIDAGKRKLTLVGDLDAGNFRIKNVGAPKDEDDVVTVGRIQDILDELDAVDINEETTESDEEGIAAGRGGRRSKRGRKGRKATSRFRRVIDDEISQSLIDAIPTVAPPNVAAVSALGTTTDPVLFALSDHTHGGLLGAPPAGGAAGEVAFFTSTFEIGSDPNFFWDDTNKRLSVGGSENTIVINGVTFGSDITTHNISAAGEAQFVAHKHSAIAATASTFIGARSRGTDVAETVVSDNDVIGRLLFVGHDGTDYERVGQVHVEMDEATPGAAAMGGALVFSTTSVGSVTLAERARFSSDAMFDILVPVVGNNPLHLRGSRAVDAVPLSINSHATTVGGIRPQMTINQTLSFNNAASVYVGLEVGSTALAAATWTIDSNLVSAVGAGGRIFAFIPTVKNTASTARSDMGAWEALVFAPKFRADGAACTVPFVRPFRDSTLSDIINAGTLAITEHTTVYSEPTYGASVTVTNRRGLWYRNRLSTGTVTTSVGVEVDDQTVGTLVAAIRSAVASGTGKWFLLSTGTAVSAILGGVRFGSGTTGPDGSSVVHIDGGYTQKRTAATDADYTALLTDCIIEFPAITANRVLNLPTVASAGAGKVYYLVKTTGAFSITIDPNGAELVNGAATLAALGAAATYDTVRIYCTGAAWIASLMV